MTFADSINTCFSKYFEVKGRASRSEYWWFYLLYLVFYLASLATNSKVLLVVALAMIIPLWTAGVRRLHDVNKSGWFLLVPIYNIVLLVTKGTPGQNRFDGPAATGLSLKK